MKIGSDAVLMGSLLSITNPSSSVLEIGSSTGVIGLMLAQRFPDINVKAIEIDAASTQVSKENFKNSNWGDRLESIHADFLTYQFNTTYHHILSNPPYFLNALKSDRAEKNMAKHIDWNLFQEWLLKADVLLKDHGMLSFILPTLAFEKTDAYLKSMGYKRFEHIAIQSFEHTEAIRHLCSWQKQGLEDCDTSTFVLYEAEKVHSKAYVQALKDFLIIF